MNSNVSEVFAELFESVDKLVRQEISISGYKPSLVRLNPAI